jgi:protein-L-isoaspartate(D-aspartate) O-methyltransferase
MVEQIQAWDRQGRDGVPAFAYWPTGSVRPESGEDTAVLVKTHGVATISWSPEADTSGDQSVLHDPEK